MKSFICRGCLNLVTSLGCTSIDIGANANLELVVEFCFLGNMLSVDGDAGKEMRERIGIEGIMSVLQQIRFCDGMDICCEKTIMIDCINIWSMKWSVRDPEVDEGVLGEKLWKKTVKHVDDQGRCCGS